MSGARADEYLTVPEAAKALRVSPSTIWRWIDDGRLPAYRIGQRKVRVKSNEVAGLIRPARFGGETGSATGDVERLRQRLSRDFTDDEKTRALAALDAVGQLDQEILARHGVEWFTPASIDLLHELREERARDLA